MTSPSDLPIIESFIIRGLNGYKNIKLTTTTAAKIISAENGTGKTTILNALYAVLSGKYSYLKDINFVSLSIKFRGHDEIEATQKEINESLNGSISSLPTALTSYFTKYGVSELGLAELIETFRGEEESIEDNLHFKRVYLESPHTAPDMIAKLKEIVGFLPEQSSDHNELRRVVAEAMGNTKVLYFPTYRRIEADLPEFTSPRRHDRHLYRQNIDTEWSEGKLINFGLRDVERRLERITDDIRRGTFEAYARISGRTLDQLVSPVRKAPADEGSYDISAIKVVLGRIGKSGSDTEKQIIRMIESEDISKSEHDYLRYFLAQMVEVYKEKQVQESAVESFVKVVDSYWSGPGAEKTFKFDKVSAVASVKNNITKENLSLNSLSSGEKQVISIFARLYLELSRKYVVLIDEPELSLSMEWQRRFLPDILSASSCVQLIAITHSPFIFANELDPFAGSLSISFSGVDSQK